MLVDGHEAQLEHIHTCIGPHRVEVTLMLLFIHVIAYSLEGGLVCFHAPGSEDGERRVGECALQILNGKASDVAAGMRRSAILCLSADEICSTTMTIWPQRSPSPPGSSKGPAVTWSRIA